MNEERRLPLTLEAVSEFVSDSGLSVEVIVVDAASTDSTVEVARSFSDRIPTLRVLQAPEVVTKAKKGAAVRAGMLAASGDARCFIDADNAAPVSQVASLLPLLADADVVAGTRFAPGGDAGSRPFVRRALSWGSNLIVRSVLGVRQSDAYCPLKLFSAQAAESLFSRAEASGFSFDAEVLALAAALDMRVVEVPVTWSNVEGSKVDVVAILESLREVFDVRRRVVTGAYDISTPQPTPLPLLLAGPALVLAGALVVAAAANTTGAGSRVYLDPPRRVSVDEPADAFFIWKDAGVRGRILVDFDEQLRMDDSAQRLIASSLADDRAMRETVTSDNYITAAIYDGVVRRIYKVVDDSRWQDAAAAFAKDSNATPDGPRYRVVIAGVPVIFTRIEDLPDPDEQVLVYVERSAYDAAGNATVDQLTGKLGSDLVITHE